ncbi:hypothetical protein ACHAWF_008986 [Thalassiosira exigua]
MAMDPTLSAGRDHSGGRRNHGGAPRSRSPRRRGGRGRGGDRRGRGRGRGGGQGGCGGDASLREISSDQFDGSDNRRADSSDNLSSLQKTLQKQVLSDDARKNGGGGDDKQRRGSEGGPGNNRQRGPPPRNQQRQLSSNAPSHLPAKHEYRANAAVGPDERLATKLGANFKDPRGDDPSRRLTAKARKNGSGTNTESFDPASTLVRPDVRVWVGSKDKRAFDKPLKHDDVVIVPELFGDEENWDLYYQLVEEMTSLQKENVKGSEWVSWHEGAHLIAKNPAGSKTFDAVIDRLCEYFRIARKSVGTRFNWYRDSTDWKPFHHDSAAFNPQRAKTQNITVGVSFGARRELSFIRATPLDNGNKFKMYFPQTNNGVFSFGRDVNILFKHGVNALPEEEQDGKGRISIILWGLADGVIEEEGSPPLLGSDGQGPHAQRRHGRHNHGKSNRGRR